MVTSLPNVLSMRFINTGPRALGTYAVRPELIPDRCGTSNACGLTPAARVETNAILAGDPYVADLLLGALLAALLIVAAGAALVPTGEHGRTRTTA